jgi:kumamolisin
VNEYVNFPASDPNSSAVGGTSVGSNGYLNEIAWSGSGGGSSPRFTKPYWQTEIVTPGPHRDLPDLSFAADPNYGNPLVYAGVQNFTTLTGGTSWSTPIFAAMMLEINQSQNKKKGNVSPNMYNNARVYGYKAPGGSGASAYPRFRDITAGPCGGTAAGGPGYDICTGIGSGNGVGLAQTL